MSMIGTEKITSAAPSERELFDQQVEDARAALDKLAASCTQREWLQITMALDRTRQQIGEDVGLSMLALAWVKEKHAHGGASWDRLLDMTDAELEALHGFPPGDGADLSTEPGSGSRQLEDAETPATNPPAAVAGNEPAGTEGASVSPAS